MAYSELIKNFDRIREYMRAFYVYGFKNREEYDLKSVRGYDDERRRIESWLGDLMGFRRTAEGKAVFLSVDSRGIARNPLMRAFQARSFTKNDIALHFMLLDLLQEGEALSVREIVDRVAGEYLKSFENAKIPDESTVRKKLTEYVLLGLLAARREGQELLYSRSRDSIDLPGWADTVAFYSEADSLGVIGGYLLNRLEEAPDAFRFKHHYMLRVLESELLLAALGAIREKRNVKLIVSPRGAVPEVYWTVTPVKVLASTQTGRYYLCAFDIRRGRIVCYRMDHLRAVEPLEEEPRFNDRAARFEAVRSHLWGAGLGSNRRVCHVEMTVFAGEGEGHIPQRLEREKRCGWVERVDDEHFRFTADVYDPSEMLPWIRTFIGRITGFRCDDPEVAARLRSDVLKALEGYEDAVQ
jgi:hypothetical protein